MLTSCHSWGLGSMMKACWMPPQSSSTHRSRKRQEKAEETDGNSENSHISSLPDDLFIDCLVRLPRSSLQASISVSHRWYKILTSKAYYELRKESGRIDSILHVFCRSRSGLEWAVFDKNRKGWTRGSLSSQTVMNVCGNKGLLASQLAVLNNKVFILGFHSYRTTSRSCTIVYDTWTQSIIRRAPMMRPKKNFACCVISGRIYVAGGSIGRHASWEANVYIPESDLWKPIAKMPTKRSGCFGAAVDGIFYVIGGYNCRGEKSNCFSAAGWPYIYVGTMDSYDPGTNTWRKTKPLPMLGRVIACSVIGSHIYVLCSDPIQLSFFKYDTVNDSWSRVNLPYIPNFKLNFSCFTMGTYFYIVQVEGCFRIMLVYDTEMHEWSRGPDLPLLGIGAICAVVEC